MNALRLSALLAYTFGAMAYGGLLVMWVRELGRLGWAARPNRQVDLLNGALMGVSFMWFCGLVAQILIALAGRDSYGPLEIALMLLAYSFPPLIMHITWSEAAHSPRIRARFWSLLVGAAYVVAAALPLGAIWVMLDPATSGATYRLTFRIVGAGLPLLFIATAVFCIAIVGRERPRGRPVDQGQRRAMGALFALMLFLFVAILAVSQLQGGMNPIGYALVGPAVEVAARSLPLIFLFVSTYFESRFHFFDLFVKRGFSMLLAVGVLALWFTLALPVLAPFGAHPVGPWLFALAVLPVVALGPWVYGRLGRMLDRRWLGRPYPTAEAVTRFLAALRSATSESDALARAEAGLGDIFRAPVSVRADAASPEGFEIAHEAAVACPDGPPLRLLLGPRAGGTPYFSQDVALVRSLADVFASVLHNLRLQSRRHAEQQRAQEMSLIASQSELKALRAQINPHFLFNALNAIAGLLHRDPAGADRTIEKLADVFRYTLRGSETEWVTLEDELEFVRAYLDVEHARFGDRLEATVRMDPGAAGARLPTMIVHTLVENAVKHGVATVRGRAVLEVRARVAEDRLLVSVSDNGPGFPGDTAPRDGDRAGGYGLVNIRERLAGHFGAEAALEITRDEAQARTVVTVSLPLVRSEPARLAGAAR